MLFNSGGAAKVSRVEGTARGRMSRAFQPPAASRRLDRRADQIVSLGGRRPASVLLVKRSKRCRDIGPDAYDALLYSGPKQSNPKIAAKEQFGAAHRGRAPGMGGAIKFHLFDCRGRIVHDAAARRARFVHPRLTTRVSARLDLNY